MKGVPCWGVPTEPNESESEGATGGLEVADGSKQSTIRNAIKQEEGVIQGLATK